MPIVFKTPGLLDIRAITTFGINAKPNSQSPIGFFGTGLKYAIAVLVRNKCIITLRIGKDQYEFQLHEDSFRDKEFGFINMVHTNKVLKLFNKTQLPFTTELGKTWELWQAFRELHSNTLDENGVTFFTNTDDLKIDPTHNNRTLIIVESGKFEEEYHEMDKTFLPGGLRERHMNGPVQTFIEPSKHVYYRGMRVMDLPDPSKLTYNILKEISLTEDRTAKYSWEVEGIIRDYLVTHPDESVIQVAVRDAEKNYEGKIDFSSSSDIPSTQFSSVVTARTEAYTSPTAREHAKRYDPVVRQKEAEKPWIEKLQDAILDFDYYKASEIMRTGRKATLAMINREIEYLESQAEWEAEKAATPTNNDEGIPF